MLDLIFLRCAFVLLLAGAAWFLRPFSLEPSFSVLLGIAGAALVLLCESRLREVSLKRLSGAAAGSLLGILGAFLITLVLRQSLPASSSTVPFLQIATLLLMAYVGLMLGAYKGDLLNLSALGGVFGGETKANHTSFKVLDTSVIIDGRIADVLETGFLDGVMVIPQFVLRELQLVADSADSLKRNRGRRGLDVLQRVQKNPKLSIRIVEDDFPQVREVDLKLIELAKLYDCKIVTNDFNLD